MASDLEPLLLNEVGLVCMGRRSLDGGLKRCHGIAQVESLLVDVIVVRTVLGRFLVSTEPVVTLAVVVGPVHVHIVVVMTVYIIVVTTVMSISLLALAWRRWRRSLWLPGPVLTCPNITRVILVTITYVVHRGLKHVSEN